MIIDESPENLNAYNELKNKLKDNMTLFDYQHNINSSENKLSKAEMIKLTQEILNIVKQ